MRYIENVHSTKRPQTFEINIDTVYKRSNIHEIEDGFEYNEEQYEMIEYLRDTVPQLELAIAELSVLVGGVANVQ